MGKLTERERWLVAQAFECAVGSSEGCESYEEMLAKDAPPDPLRESYNVLQSENDKLRQKYNETRAALDMFAIAVKKALKEHKPL